MKKTIAAVITAMILIVMPLSAFAADTVSRLVDGSALLSGSEKTALEDKLNSLSAAHKTDIIAVTDTIPEGQSGKNMPTACRSVRNTLPTRFCYLSMRRQANGTYPQREAVPVRSPTRE